MAEEDNYEISSIAGYRELKGLKTDQFVVNVFITNSLLICKVDILHC